METKLLNTIEKRAMHPLVGAGLGAGVAAGGLFALDPYIRGQVKTDIQSLISKRKKNLFEDSSLQVHPEAAHARATNVALALQKAGFNPKRHSIGISATGGTGKSTLASLLAKRLNLKKAYKKDSITGTGRKFPTIINETGTKPGTIYEQTHLLNITDPDKFDFMIKLERPTKEIYESLKKRERGAFQRHMTDYPRLKKAINYAFDTLPGKSISPEVGVDIKRRPAGGFLQGAILNKKLRSMGEDLNGMSREEKIYKITGGDTTAFNLVSKLGLDKVEPNVFRPDMNYNKMLGLLGIVGAGALTGGLIAR